MQKDVWFLQEKKNRVKCGCRCKNVDAYETNAHCCRILVTPLRINAINAGDIFDVHLFDLTNTYYPFT
jgi:hypothetical protein